MENKKITMCDLIENVEFLGRITGRQSINNTLQRFNIGGCDLGIPLYNSKTNKMYVFFGDTFEGEGKHDIDWRNNVCLTSSNFNLSNGLIFDDALLLNNNRADCIIYSEKKNFYEMTKIPTGAIEIDGIMYMFYFSKYSWDNLNEYSMNYGGVIKSIDNGKTWERVNNLSWADHSSLDNRCGENVGLPRQELIKIISKPINVDGIPTNNFDIQKHEGYFFTQITAVDGKDGYIYILGEGGYRQFGIKLGRVLKQHFENFDMYEYFNGFDINNNPIWLSGCNGLHEVCKKDNLSSFIINDKCGEHSVMYNEYLKKWMVTCLVTNKGICAYTANNIYGPYSESYIICGSDKSGQKLLSNFKYDDGTEVLGAYSAFSHEKWSQENGKIIYYTMSQWLPLYNSILIKMTLK